MRWLNALEALWVTNAVWMLTLMYRANVRGLWLAIWLGGCLLMFTAVNL